MTQALISGVVLGGIYGLLALGIVLVHKGSRVLNFAQSELGTFSLFIAWALVSERHMPWLVGAIAAIATAAVISLAFERLVVSRMAEASRLSVAVATVGMMLLLLGFEAKVWGSAPKALAAPIAGRGPEIAGVFVSPTQLISLGVAAAIGLGLTAFLRRTDFGLGVLAAAQDADAARLVGVPLARVSAFTWVTAGALGAVAALLIEPSIGLFAPGFMLGLFVPALAAALLAGLSSMSGAFAGGLVIGVIDSVVRKVFVQSTVPGLQTVAIFAVISAVLLFRPQGVFREATAR